MIDLTQSERLHPIWVKITQYLDEKLESARLKLEGPLDDHDTANVRGYIKALRVLKALGDERPIVDE